MMGQIGVLDPIKFWSVPEMPQMVLPASSRGRVYHPSNIKVADIFR